MATGASRIARVLTVLVAAVAGALVGPPTGPPIATAAPCPDVEVVFARGTFEPPGIGGTGEAFVESLRSQAGGKSVEVYPVNYPASLAFSTAADGVLDASNRIRDMAARCADTKMVLGGYSQGAAVIGYVTADAVPAGFVPPDGITGPMAPAVADNVAAVALFGKPSSGFLNRIYPEAPPITIGNLYAAKTIDLCIPGDGVCSPDGSDSGAHERYVVDGTTGEAADFAARRLTS